MAISNKVAIMQPTYLPWVGYFALMDYVDTFIFLDDVQFERRSWQQRNRIKFSDRELMLTVPVKRVGRENECLASVEVDHSSNFIKKHIGSICQSYSYNKSSTQIITDVTEILSRKHTKLVDLNLDFIVYFKDLLGIHTNILRSSELNCAGSKTEKLINLCLQVNATDYISPIGSASYLNNGELFNEKSLNFEYFVYNPVEYKQHGEVFLPSLSILDLIYNMEEKSLEILRPRKLNKW